MRLSVCIEMVYDDEPFADRVGRAADAGADAVEFWDWRARDVGELAAAAERAGVDVAGCTAGGTLTDPEGVDAAAATIRESIGTAAEYGIGTLIVTTGPERAGLDRATQRDAVVETLSRVAPDAEAAGVTLALEPLNTAVDHPENFLATSDEGFGIVDRVGSPGVGLLYDVYHQQITEGNLTETLTGRVDDVVHVHVADVPGRHEPGTGEVNYANVLAALDDAGYDGCVGCEFSPTGDPDVAVAGVRDLL